MAVTNVYNLRIIYTFKHIGVRFSRMITQKPSALGAYNQVTGDTAERLYRLATDIPDGPKQWIRDWLRRKYGLNI